MTIRKIVMSILLLFVSCGLLAAQTSGESVYVPTYELGESMLSLNAGLFQPLFFQAPSLQMTSTNLSLGGVGSILYATFLSDRLAAGLELEGMFAFSPNARTLFMVPLTLRVMHFFRFYPFEIPVSFSAGVSFTRLSESFQIMPILKPGVSFLWNYSLEWAFGVNLQYWWTPNIYFGPTPSGDQSRFGNFLSVTLSALYHIN